LRSSQFAAFQSHDLALSWTALANLGRGRGRVSTGQHQQATQNSQQPSSWGRRLALFILQIQSKTSSLIRFLLGKPGLHLGRHPTASAPLPTSPPPPPNPTEKREFPVGPQFVAASRAGCNIQQCLYRHVRRGANERTQIIEIFSNPPNQTPRF